MEVEEAPSGAEQQQPRAPTTTISTISVHSGDTRLVIALLQSREWLQLKVLEVHPELTKLGASLKEAAELQRAHDEVLLQLQSKQSPVEELLRQADQLISTQKPRAEVYAAMAESLGLAWKDVNTHLEQRKLILDLNVSYQSRSEDCFDRMRALEIACQDPALPVEIEAVKQLLTKLHDLKRLMLESLMTTLQDGKLLLEKLKEISTQGTLDSRPDHIKISTEYSISQVEHWLENLHDRRRLLEIAWKNRKIQLEQCLALALLATDLKELENILCVRYEALSRGSDQLGDSSASAELLLHEHKKLLPEAKDLQDRALKVTKATEQLVSSGHFAAEQATAQAYSILNMSAEYLDAIEQRELLLSRAIAFFRSAHTTLTKLDQLEVQLTTTKLSASSPQLIQLHSQVSKSLDEMTAPPLQEGYSLLETIGRGSPGIEGVKRTVEEIENRKIHLGELCTAHREENVRLSQAFTSFLEKQNELFSWLVSIAEAFLQGHQDMGSVLAMAKDFLELHHQLLNDLQKKGVEINALLLTLPPILECLDDEQREDVDQKVDSLHSHWLNLKSMLEVRIDLADIYVKFHTLAVQLANEFDAAEEEFKKSSDGINEDTIRLVEQKWLSIQQLYGQLTSVGKNFIEDASKVGDPYLDIKRASLCVETLLEHFGNRQLLISESWQTWQTSITVEREFKVQWEMNVTESTRTLDWVSKLDDQLYPILTSNTKSSKAIAKELEEKLQTVLPEIKRAQAEVEIRIKTAETLSLKGDTHGQKEAIVEKLMQQHNKLQVIITDYQILLEMLISFFKNLSEIEKTIENLQSQYKITRLPNVITEVELLLKEHEASRQAVLELFKFTHNESEQIIHRICQQEPQVAAHHDIQKVTILLEEKRQTWELAWTERKLQMEEHHQLCQFDADLHQINSSLNDLSIQLSAIHGQYGESLASAKATSLAFVYFEKTIELLEQRIQTFVNTAEQMLSSEHVSSSHIEYELKLLKSKWEAFRNQVAESRRLIDLSIEYFQLVEEAEEWFREGSKLLLTIARKSTTVKLPEEATQLLNEVEYFLKPGETRQDERIKQISKLAIELYGEEHSKQVTLVLNENKEMLDSFTVISLELSTLAKNLKAAEEQRERQKKEQEEVDASLAAARAEAAAAKAAAAAAEEARKAAEAAAKALQEATPLLQKVEVAEALPLPPSEEKEKPRKSPSPPLKKAKFIDETPKPVAPVFTVPLHDAAIEEGEKFTFECRVTGFPMPEVIWYKDSISIQNNPDYQTTFDQGICTLTIEETFTEDSARFICRAANAAGTAETCATLSVKEAEPEEQLSPPHFMKRLESNSAQEGSTFQFECKVEGNPLPTVQWFKNDACIDNSADYVITYNNGEAVLRFEEVFLEDQADYSCKAANKLGTDICTAKLTVEPLEPTEIPSFITPLSNVMARAGQKIKLECEVTGIPLPELTWSHNTKVIKETRDIKVQYDDKKATLVINEAFPKDAGIYIISAKNIAGEATSSCNVSVKGRLPTETSDSELASDMEPVKPSIQMGLKDLSVFEGKRVRLDCVIVGQPEPEVIWYYNDRPVKESTDFKLLFQGDRCSLIIEEAYLEDAGEYKVVAINSGGEASNKCNLTVKSLGDTEPATRTHIVEVVEIVGMAPKFSKLLTDILASEGDKVVFDCCINGDPKPEIKWYLNNEEIQDSDKIKLYHDEEGNVNLTILEALPENKGVYTVKAHNSSGEAKCFANLIVKTISSPEIKRKVVEVEDIPIAPAFKELFADRIVNENETTKFECVITGKPTPKVDWYFNEELVSGKNFLISTNGDRHTLAIFQASQEHSGKVACVAENEIGKATCVARLSVKLPSPIITDIIPLQNNTISDHQESSSFTMKKSVYVQSSSSQVTSSSVSSEKIEPHMEVHSYSSQTEETVEKVGEKPPIQVQTQKTQQFHQQNQDKPVIHQHTIVKVLNGVSESKESMSSTSSTPVSSPKPTRKSIAPRFVTPLNGKIVDQGADVILDGILDGFPQPTVSWYKNGQDLSPKDGSVIISWELNHARLELKNVAVKDAGRYTCKAVNSVGTASSTADVVVKKTIFPPVFGRRLQAQIAKVGERISMDVEVTGTPDPTVTWYKDNEQILGAIPGGPFRTKIQGNSYSLVIEKAELNHSGKFMVKAMNAGGEARCIADFIVIEPQPEKQMQSEPDLHMTTHVVFKDIKEEKIQQQDHHHKTISSKVTTEKIHLEPVHPEIIKPHTTEIGTSPISLSPHRTSPSIGKPITTESTTVTESTTSEKQLSITMERTSTPVPHISEELHPTKEVKIPVVVESKTEIVTENKLGSAPEEMQLPKEFKIPIHIEEKKSERIIPVKLENKEMFQTEQPSQDNLQTISDKEEELIKENICIESASISKKTAFDFFMSKLNVKEEDVVKDKIEEQEIVPLKTSVKENVSQFELQSKEVYLKEDKNEEPEIIPLKTSVKENISQFELQIKDSASKDDDKFQLSKQFEEHPIPVVHEKVDPILKPTIDIPSSGSPSIFKTEKENLSSIKSQFQSESPLLDSQNLVAAQVPQSQKFSTFPFESSSTTHFQSEHSKTTRFEKQVTQQFMQHSTSTIVDEFNLQPEPPPEIGYIPKTDIPSKLRLDMPSRVRKLEESHRVLSPVEIPSGAVRIFPTPLRTETPVFEKIEPQQKSKSDISSPKPEKEIEVEEELIMKEIVEEVSVQKKVHLPGTGDWTLQHVAPMVKPVLEEHSPAIPKSWSPQPPIKAEFPREPSPEIEMSWHPPSALEVDIPKTNIKTKSESLLVKSQTIRPVSPKPSAEALAMEKLWAPSRTPEPESMSLPLEPMKRVPSPKPILSESLEQTFPPSFTKSSLQETMSSSTYSSSEIKRAASPRPSAEGVAMEKLWTPHKPAEPEPVIVKPVSTGLRSFEKAMSPKPSQEGLAMDKIWAHKHPDSALKKTWPPPQSVEEKPVIPWAMTGSIDKTWPPSEPTQSTSMLVQEDEIKVLKREIVKEEQIKEIIKKEQESNLEPVIKEVPSTHSDIIRTDFKKESKSNGSYISSVPTSSIPVQHYIAEARVIHSSSKLEEHLQSTIKTTEHLESKSEEITETIESFSSTLQSNTESSPKVVEERVLKPSEANWPPFPKETDELKASKIVKEESKTEQIQNIIFDGILQPGPPPEIGFAPAPPEHRRQSLVEAIEQDLQKDLEKEPSRHLVGAVRTIPPPPQKEKSIPPPLPPKEKDAPPPPIPPKEKLREVKISPQLKKDIKKSIFIEQQYEKFPDLEPFPFKPDEPKPKITILKGPPPPTPSKFIRGEFASSDYESDIDSIHIPAKWRPYESDTEEVIGYRRVVPPTMKQPKRPKSTEPEPLPPSKFDQPPHFAGPPRPEISKVHVSKEIKSEVIKTTKTETKNEKVKKHHHHHHHSSETKKKHSPPVLKPGSPPIFMQSTAQQETIVTEQNKTESSSPPKSKPDSPKLKTKPAHSEFPESGYMADTDEPIYLRETTHKYSHFKHEESSKTIIEQTTIINDKVPQRISETVQQQQQQQQQQNIEKPIPIKPHPAPKIHHKQSDLKTEKKVMVPSTTVPTKTKKNISTASVMKDFKHSTTQFYKDSELEPFPFIAESSQSTIKRIAGPPPPSPSKFVRGEFRESDYESDYDSRIPAKWRPCDSDADEPSYKSVRPVLTPSGSRINSRASVEIRTPTPPTEFDNPPQFGGPPRPKFQPIEKPTAPPVKLEDVLKATEKPQKVFRPTPITPKAPSPVEVIIATPAVREKEVLVLHPGTPPEMGYAPPPPRIAPFENATQMETSKVMKFAESTEHSHRVVSVQQTTRVIKFGDKEQKKIVQEPKLEPFPFKPEPEHPCRTSGPPPTTPKKFIPGEFRESDYESDYEGRIKPKWTPGDSDTDELHYRKVKAPPITRSVSVPDKRTDRIPTPMEFDTGPVIIPSPIKVAIEPKTNAQLEFESEQKRLKRVEEMRKRFSDSSITTVQKKSVVTTKNNADNSLYIQPGEPPEFGFVPTATSYVAAKHMNEMTNTFKSKAQKFVDDIITDVKSVRENGQVDKPKIPETSADENDPQAYREESRIAEYGTKHIDPDTGLIYFKYDFGYEFGIVLPGEGRTTTSDGTKKPKKSQIDKKKDDDIDFPVIHETSKKIAETPSNKEFGKVPQFRPKKFTHSKAVKWEPMSESEMSEAEGDSVQQMKKRYSLPQPPTAMFQKAPHILIPPSRWEHASSSPVSLSPSLPSLSPRYSGQGPHSGTPGVDSTASPGGSWQGLSPGRVPRPQGRGSTPTPPSTPSTPGSTHGSVGNLAQPRKPPTFITPLRDIAVVSGQTARFECIVQAEPPPNILWSKNGRIIENSHNYQIHYRNGVCRLTIPQAFPEDGGSYTCTATNMLGTIGTTGLLQVPGERRSVRI